MKNVMLDLETFGTSPGCVVLSIGAVRFDATGVGDEFYVEISQQDSALHKLARDDDTVAWWADQGEEARGLLDRTWDGGAGLYEALNAFAAWLGPDAVVWGNGAAFDLAILTEAYRRVELQAEFRPWFDARVPWSFLNERCFRTLKNLFPLTEPPERPGVKHHALDDARYQAVYASAVLVGLGRLGVGAV